MPRRNAEASPTPPPESSGLPALPEDIRADLLRAQAASAEATTLPRAKILPAGVCLFELDDMPGETHQQLTGIILGYHHRNVLWDRPYGDGPRDPQNPERPACVSQDGEHGTPREGFLHLAMAATVATGTEQISCRGCQYNEFGSPPLVGRRGNGKACNNQRAVYLMMQGRQLPVELILPPTSITAFDEYLIHLVNRGLPAQAVVSLIRQERVQSASGLTYAKVTFTAGDPIDADLFAEVMRRRREYNFLIQIGRAHV